MARSNMVAEQAVSSEGTVFSCDLGLGLGLKPGGLPKIEQLDFLGTSDSVLSPSVNSESSESPLRGESSSELLLQDETSSGCVKHTCRCSCPNTSRDAKEMCRSKISQWTSPERRISLRLRRSNSDNSASYKDTVCPSSEDTDIKAFSDIGRCSSLAYNSDYRALQCNLQKAKLEIDNLKGELETCQQQLQSKYGAVEILKHLSRAEHSKQKQLSEKALGTSRKLEQEVNKLQWELELKQSYLMDSEQTWAERFDRVATENAALLVALHTRSDELRKLSSEKNALVRERDELVAALDIRDAIGYNLSNYSDKEAVLSARDIMVELATLGACQCRGLKQEPCSCARAAAAAKRQTTKLKKELKSARRNEEEALLAAEAYRMAFEQQLSKYSSLIHDLLDKTKWKKTWKFCLTTRAKPCRQNHCCADRMQLAAEIEAHKDEVVEKLVDMLSDKCEAMAHQRVTTKLLAAKLQSLEKTVEELSSGFKHDSAGS